MNPSLLAAASDIVGLASLCAAARDVLLAYRQGHAERNVLAIEAGSREIPELVRPAWADTVRTEVPVR